MFAGLSLDQAPPFRAPLKFFLTAPIFALIAGVILLFGDNFEIHSPLTIAVIHLLTIGFMVMIVFGALQQMLPVVAGAVIPKPMIVANTTYTLLVLGIITFVLGFLYYEKLLLFISSNFLLMGLFLFTSIALWQLLKVQKKSWIVLGMTLSLVFLMVAFFIGIHLMISHALGNLASSHYTIALLHYNYIFFGFIFLLIVSITFQVVPMFWVADSFSTKQQKTIILITTILLILYGFNVFLQLGYGSVYKFTLSGILLYFGYITVKKLQGRKRKLKDISVYFYLTSMVFLSLGTLFWIAVEFYELPLKFLGVLWGIGFVYTLMNGMLYKIVPFLTWFHLSSKGIFDVPTMRDMISIKWSQIQFNLHLSSILFFIIGLSFNSDYLIKYGVIFFILSNILLFINLYKAARIFLVRF
jgi:hypothetical protein